MSDRTAALKKLYWRVAKTVHPDLGDGQDKEDKDLRHRLMIDANDAFERKDSNRLEGILDTFQSKSTTPQVITQPKTQSPESNTSKSTSKQKAKPKTKPKPESQYHEDSAPNTAGSLKAGDTIINSMGMNLAYIPSSQFFMGDDLMSRVFLGCNTHETQRKVTLTNGFYMGVTTVTQSQWQAIMKNNPSQFNGDELPVERVSWSKAVEMCLFLSEKEGRHYRLPSESEWEYACRAGTTTAYYTGDCNSALDIAGWYKGNNARRDGVSVYGSTVLDEAGWFKGNSGDQTHPVGQKKPNTWGLYDMHGNVWEWCSDWYGKIPRRNQSDPIGPTKPSYLGRVLRGGSWNAIPQYCRSAYRFRASPYAVNAIGFRVVLDLSK